MLLNAAQLTMAGKNKDILLLGLPGPFVSQIRDEFKINYWHYVRCQAVSRLDLLCSSYLIHTVYGGVSKMRQVRCFKAILHLFVHF